MGKFIDLFKSQFLSCKAGIIIYTYVTGLVQWLNVRMCTKAPIPVAGTKFISKTHYCYNIPIILCIINANQESYQQKLNHVFWSSRSIIHSHWGNSPVSFCRNSVSKIWNQKLAEIQLSVPLEASKTHLHWNLSHLIFQSRSLAYDTLNCCIKKSSKTAIAFA